MLLSLNPIPGAQTNTHSQTHTTHNIISGCTQSGKLFSLWRWRQHNGMRRACVWRVVCTTIGCTVFGGASVASVASVVAQCPGHTRNNDVPSARLCCT